MNGRPRVFVLRERTGGNIQGLVILSSVLLLLVVECWMLLLLCYILLMPKKQNDFLLQHIGRWCHAILCVSCCLAVRYEVSFPPKMLISHLFSCKWLYNYGLQCLTCFTFFLVFLYWPWHPYCVQQFFQPCSWKPNLYFSLTSLTLSVTV